MGAKHVINYRTTPEWGKEARKLTPGGEGVDFVIELGGPLTLRESINSVKVAGEIDLVGSLGGGHDAKDQPTVWDVRSASANVRSILVGSRSEFEEMNRVIETVDIKPVLEEKTFSLDQLREAYQYLVSPAESSSSKLPLIPAKSDAKHVGKVVVDIE